MTIENSDLSVKRYLKKKCTICGQTSTIYENLCPKCRTPMEIVFNHTQFTTTISDRIKALDQYKLTNPISNWIKTNFEESVGAYLENKTLLTILNRWIDQTLPFLENELTHLLLTQPGLHAILEPFQQKLTDTRTQLERVRQIAYDQQQRNPVEILFAEYEKRYSEYDILAEKIDPEEKHRLEQELTNLSSRIRQIFGIIHNGYRNLQQEIARFHGGLDAVTQNAPIIQSQAEEYSVLEKTIHGMVRVSIT